jgi:hypothetical protein
VNRGASRRPLFLTAAAVLVLVAVVALASSGSTPAGDDEIRQPADVLLDTIFSLGLVLLIPAAAILVYGLTQRKAIAREIATGRYPRWSFASFMGLMILILIFGLWGVRHFQRGEGGDEITDIVFPGLDRPLEPTEPGIVQGSYEREFAWIPVLVILVIAAIGIGSYIVAERRRRPPLELDDAVAAIEVADDLDDSLDDLRAEPDPRRAVIAAYARLELSLARAGLARREDETAEEYVSRILDRLDVERRPVKRLTALYTEAKFSQHVVDDRMKDDAIDSLGQIRDELRASAARRAEEQRAQAAAAVEEATAR